LNIAFCQVSVRETKQDSIRDLYKPQNQGLQKGRIQSSLEVTLYRYTAVIL
jgi:hypothetical protein